MDEASREQAVKSLLSVYDGAEPIDPLTSRHPEMGLDDAYAVQLAQVAFWRSAGRVLKGQKVGLTSAAMQRQLGVDQPDYGHLFADMFWLEHMPVPVSKFVQPRVEPEVAFVLKRPLHGPGVTAAEAIAAVDFVLPALEIIDSRIRDWKITIADTIADNASSGGLVLGSKPTPLSDVDLRLGGCVVHLRGEVATTGAGGAVLGSPMNSLVWLANTLGAHRVGLEAGHVVLPGSITAAIPVAVGDVVTASFAGLGSVTARFTEEA
ncbi:MAG: 2-keto-4-pentenoate hydratase [Micromonosporaceae bacterium]